jgi:hypothetical protein
VWIIFLSLFYRFLPSQNQHMTSDLNKKIVQQKRWMDMAVRAAIVQQSEEVEEMNNGLEAGDGRTVVQVPVKKYCLPFLPVQC